MVISFARSSLGQTGDGHFSPVAAYHESSDQCLILDVARFKYGPYWVDVKDLYEAMRPVDSMTDQSRGWFLNYPPKSQLRMGRNQVGAQGDGDNSQSRQDRRGGGYSYQYRGAKAIDEEKRPVEVVPIIGGGEKSEACPVGKIKVRYCSVSTRSTSTSTSTARTGSTRYE